MSIGTQIRKYRKQAGMTQAQLAELLNVSFQAVSSWENNEYLPDPIRITEIAHHLGVGAGKLLEEENTPEFTLRDKLADESHMHTMLKTALRLCDYPFAYRALSYIDETCVGSLVSARHAMHTACHALALGVATDDMIEILLYYGLCQEKGLTVFELPASPTCKNYLNTLMGSNNCSCSNPTVCMARCIDGVYNLSVSAIDRDRIHIIDVINDVETNVVPLLKTVKNAVPEWDSAVYLLRYHILSLLETYKHLM